MKFRGLRSDSRLGFSTPIGSAMLINILLATGYEHGVRNISDHCLPICGNRKVASSPILLFSSRLQPKMGPDHRSSPSVPIFGSGENNCYQGECRKSKKLRQPSSASGCIFPLFFFRNIILFSSRLQPKMSPDHWSFPSVPIFAQAQFLDNPGLVLASHVVTLIALSEVRNAELSDT